MARFLLLLAALAERADLALRPCPPTTDQYALDTAETMANTSTPSYWMTLSELADLRTVTARDRADAVVLAASSDSRDSQWNGSGEPPRSPPTAACGSRADFVTFARVDARAVDVAAGVLFRLRFPELVSRARAAIDGLARARAFDCNSYCAYFGSCESTTLKRLSKTSNTFWPCPSDRARMAPHWLRGAAADGPPGDELRAQGDGSALCALARAATAAAERAVLPALDPRRERPRCVVQEAFANVQKPGAFTDPHVHADDALGAIFYVDAPAPKPARMCFDGAHDSAQRARWAEHDPAMVRDVALGHVDMEEGDLIIAPVGWLRHWVPPIEGDAARTTLILNMVCL